MKFFKTFTQHLYSAFFDTGVEYDPFSSLPSPSSSASLDISLFDRLTNVFTSLSETCDAVHGFEEDRDEEIPNFSEQLNYQRTSLFSQIQDFLQTVWNSFASLASSLAKQVYDMFSTIIHKVYDWVMSAWNFSGNICSGFGRSALVTIVVIIALTMLASWILSPDQSIAYMPFINILTGLAMVFLSSNHKTSGILLLLIGMIQSVFRPSLPPRMVTQIVQVSPQGFPLLTPLSSATLVNSEMKEDMSLLFSTLIGSSVLCTALLAGVNMNSFTSGDFGQMMYNIRNAGQAKFQWTTQILPYFTEVWDICVGFVYKYIIGSGYVDETQFDEIKQICAVHSRMTSLEFQSKIGNDVDSAYDVINLYQRHLALKAKYIHNGQVLKLLNAMDSSIKTMYEKAVSRTPMSTGMRMEPVAIAILGDAGVGKTLLTQQMIVPLLKMVNKHNAKKDPMNELYMRSVEQEFWDGYFGQSICLYDDFGQLEEVYGTPNMEWFEYVRGTNHYSYPLHMASLENKGSTYFNSDFMILTSNLSKFKPKNMVSSTAFTRRLTITVKVTVLPEVQRADGTPAAHAVSYHKLTKWREERGLPNWDTSHYVMHELDPDTMEPKRVLTFEQMLRAISGALAQKHNEYLERKAALDAQKHTPLDSGCIGLQGDQYGPSFDYRIDNKDIAQITKDWEIENEKMHGWKEERKISLVDKRYIANVFQSWAPRLKFNPESPVYVHLLGEFIERKKKEVKGIEWMSAKLAEEYGCGTDAQRIILKSINALIQYCHHTCIEEEAIAEEMKAAMPKAVPVKSLIPKEVKPHGDDIEDELAIKPIGVKVFDEILGEDDDPIEMTLACEHEGLDVFVPKTIQSEEHVVVVDALLSPQEDEVGSKQYVDSSVERSRILKLILERKDKKRFAVAPTNILSFVCLAEQLMVSTTGRVPLEGKLTAKYLETLFDFVEGAIKSRTLRVKINTNLDFGGYVDGWERTLYISESYAAILSDFNGYENCELEDLYADALRQDSYARQHNMKTDVPRARLTTIQLLRALHSSAKVGWDKLKPWKHTLAVVAGLLGIGVAGAAWYYSRKDPLNPFEDEMKEDARIMFETGMIQCREVSKMLKVRRPEYDPSADEKDCEATMKEHTAAFEKEVSTKFLGLIRTPEHEIEYRRIRDLALREAQSMFNLADATMESEPAYKSTEVHGKQRLRRVRRAWQEGIGQTILEHLNPDTDDIMSGITRALKKTVTSEATTSAQGSELMFNASANMMTASVVADKGNGAMSERKLANVFFLTDRLMFFNRHFLYMINDFVATNSHLDVKFYLRLGYVGARKKGMEGVDVDVLAIIRSAKDYMAGKETTDFMYCEVDGITPFRNMVKHLPDAATLETLAKGTSIGMVTWRRSGKDCDRVYQTGTFRGFNDVSMTLKGIGLDEEQGLYRGVGETTITSLPGDCGGVYVVMEDGFGPQKIVGLHFGGCRGGGSTFIPLAKEYVRNIVKGMSPQQDPKEVLPNSFECGDDEFPLEGNFVPKFSISESIFNPLKSRWRESLMFEAVTPTEVGPSWLEPALNPGGPMFLGLMKNAGHIPGVDQKCVDMAIESYKRLLTDRGFGDRTDLCRILTWKEAIEGISGDDGFNPVNRSKSPGFPYMMASYKRHHNVTLGGKQHWLGQDEWTWQTTDAGKELMHDVYQLEDDSKRCVPFVVFVDTLKDEKRSLEKVMAKKTRTFAAAPMHFTIVFRKYFGGFLAHMFHNRIHLESCIGVDVHTEWSRVAQKLNYFGKGKKNIVAGDFSNYDGTMNSHIFPRIIEIINWWYSSGPESMEAKREANKIRENLWKAVCYSHHIVGNIIYQWTHGQPSGNPSTAISNSIYNSLVMRYAFYKSQELQGMHFNTHVSMVIYGDDNAFAVSPLAKAFNMELVSKRLAEIGMTYTDESKKTGAVSFRDLSEISFLKRNFVWCPISRKWMAPLALRSILEMTNWVSSSISPREAIRLNCESAIRELYFHDKDTFDEYQGKIASALLLATGYQVTSLSWEQARTKIAAGDVAAVLSPTEFAQ